MVWTIFFISNLILSVKIIVFLVIPSSYIVIGGVGDSESKLNSRRKSVVELIEDLN